ncbi:MAG TPA: NAD-dependent succinate-semialdehyde dehydrogenase [Solirubrobacteraceae bacterium]|nr:NAD-dependent succinate-semialdehyde dehydrogenase [Solirubrobacteraceae bacterium]
MSATETAANGAAGAGYRRVAMYIDGEWTEGTSGRSEPILDPATETTLGDVPLAAPADLDRALDAAARGFPTWRDTAVDERSSILHRAADLVRARADEIARTMTLEQGKPLGEARGEVVRVAKLLDWDAEEARRAYGRIIPCDVDTELTVIHQPVGPVAAFTPWNFPAGSPMRKLAAALSAGCSIVVKASEEVPGTACALVECFEEAGVPAGVLNLVFGVPAEVSERLIDSPVTRMVAFTGSIAVGKHLAGLAARHMKPSIMELGGHAPVVVCADADPERAAAAVAGAKFVNAGQVCTSPSRVYVHESLHDRFLDALLAATAGVKVGNGLQEGVRMGPLANARRLQAMQELVADATERGGAVACGGARLEGDGLFFAPTVLADVPADARVMREEPFGPVAPVRAFSELADALEAANSLPYGLAAYGFTESAATADVLKRGLEAGIISINHCGGSVPEAPSGGVKESGYGKEGGAEGLDGYLVTKRVSHRLR